MSYLTWDWDSATGSGWPSAFMPEHVDPILTQESEAGVVSTEPLFTAPHWVFNLEFSVIRPWGYIYLVNWRHTHRGGIPFYFRWPYELAGIPPEAYLADPGGITPWSSEIAPLAGHGPTYLVYWVNDTFQVARRKGVNNYYNGSGTIQLRSV